MSQPDSGSPSILDTLRNFKPTQKPKISHVPSYSSSSEGSPVMRQKAAVMVISDSESDSEPVLCLDSDDNDCIIVTTDLSDSKTVNDTDNDSLFKISDVKTKPINDVKEENEKSPVACSSFDVANDSDEDRLRQIKRKKTPLNNKKKKRRKKIDSDSDGEIYDDSFKREQVYDSDEEDADVGAPKSALRKKVVDLLQNGSEKDLNAIPNMNPKKLETIISNRPYEDWMSTVKKFNDIKGLTCSMLNVICDTIVAREIVFDLMTKCEELAVKIEKKISSCTIVSKAPSLLNPEMKLSDYQLLGLNWLALMRSRSLNSILADEMGLGKTIQVIAFLAYLKENELVLSGYPHLVVVPSSTLDNWYEEFRIWCPSLNVVVYHGNQMERRDLRISWGKEGFGDTDVILTTYSCATSTREEKKLFRIREFNYIIFDEAHMLKNMNTQRYDALVQFNGNFKILLTGTPLQNNLLELMSLMIFLMPDLFRSKVHHIKLLFAKSKMIDENSSTFEKEKLTQAKRIIEPFMLRRLKEQVLRSLPVKTVTVEKCTLASEQQIKYDELLAEFRANCESSDPNNYMVYFMKLRKLANHPLLLRYHYTEDKLEKMATLLARDTRYKGSNVEYIKDDLYFLSDFELFVLCQEYESLHPLEYTLPDELFCSSGKLEKLTPMLNSLKANGHRVLIFSQFIFMLDILQEYCRVKNFTFLRLDGSTPTPVRQELIDLFNMDNEIFIFFLSTKAGGMGINLTAADTVIIHDVDFNPYNDKQAEDRCHRVGQKRPVQVIKLISENTVEEGIHKTATRKLHLEKEITASNVEESADSKTIIQLLKENLGMSDSV